MYRPTENIQVKPEWCQGMGSSKVVDFDSKACRPKLMQCPIGQ